MDDCYLDYGSIDEMRDELLRLRQENEKLRNQVSELDDELRECYEHLNENIDKMDGADDYDDWLENDYSYEGEL